MHNPVNKRLVWWTSFIFILGILACCISGFVTTNRFGFALEGSWCAFDRLYYDSIYGQLKETYPKWEGFKSIKEYLVKLKKFIENVKIKIDITTLTSDLKKSNEEDYNYEGYFTSEFLESIKEVLNETEFEPFIKEVNNITLPITSRYLKIIDSLKKLKNLNFYNDLEYLKAYFDKVDNDFPRLKSEFLEEYYYYAKVAKACGKVLTMVYLCLLLISATFAGVSMMFYACLKKQGYLQIFMHVLWNIIRFFIFSFFFYGAAYGMCYLALRDAVAYVMFVFGEENLTNDNSYLVPINEGKDYLRYCLINSESDYKKRLDDTLTEALSDFFKNYKEIKIIYTDYKLNRKITYNDYTSKSSIPTSADISKLEMIAEKQNSMMNIILKNFEGDADLCNKAVCDNLPEMAIRDGGIFGSFNCTFLKSDLNMMYRTIYDLSVEARILCALSCCIGFFGAIFVYFFLLVLHHYDTDLFFDKGRIFTGFEGFSNTKKKNSNDPSYKKRKLRAEIELSSRNEEYSGYQPAKNED